MDRTTTLGEIVRQAFEKFPEHFINHEEAFEYADQLTEDYTFLGEAG